MPAIYMLALTGLSTAEAREPQRYEHTYPMAVTPSAMCWGETPKGTWTSAIAVRGSRRGPDEEVVSDGGSLTMTCTKTKRLVMVELEVRVDPWPRRLPEELSCVVGDNEIVLHVRPVLPIYPTADDLRVSLEEGVEVRVRPRSMHAGLRFELPSDTSWTTVEGTVSQDGKPWDKVGCRVHADDADRPTLIVKVDHDQRGDGECTVATADAEVRIPFTIVDVPFEDAPPYEED